VSGIERRAAQLVGADQSQVERLQTVRYLPGQQFEQHHDWFQPEYRDTIQNQREHTLFVYLNDVEGEGGETDFPLLNRSFKPRRGDALFWRNCTSTDHCHRESLHQGKAPVSDTKYGLNIWVRFSKK
jgi:prolyl 4-hydroxylase